MEKSKRDVGGRGMNWLETSFTLMVCTFMTAVYYDTVLNFLGSKKLKIFMALLTFVLLAIMAFLIHHLVEGSS